MNVTNLQHLIKTMERVEPDRLDMNSWKCGTHACALGHEAMTKYAHAHGLSMDSKRHHAGDWCPVYVTKKTRVLAMGAGMRYLDIPLDVARVLFSPMKYSEGRQEGDRAKQDVLERLHLLLAAGPETFWNMWQNGVIDDQS